MSICKPENFALIRETSVHCDRETRPDSFPIIGSSIAELQNFFVAAHGLWSEKFDAQDFTNKLEQYLAMSKNDRKKHPELKMHFKDVRKAGLILGSVHHFCHESSALPESMILFLRYVGRLNDYFTKKNKGPKNARKVIKILETDDISQLDFSVGSPEIFRARVSKIAENAFLVLEKDLVGVPVFHQMRKEFRHVMNLFQLSAALNVQNLAFLHAFQYLERLNSRLGHIHDDFVGQKIKGQIVYSETMVKVPVELKQAVMHFYKSIQNQ